MDRLRSRLYLLSVLLLITSAVAQPRPAPSRSSTPPGTITLAVDATEAPRRLFHARLTIPVTPGPLTLLYPKWIPGEHGPTGPVVDLAGLKFTLAGKSIPWRRDTLDMYTLHLDVPGGATAIEVALDYLSPTSPEGFSSAASATANMAVLSWNQVLLYPAGIPSDQLQYRASVHFPAGWKFGTALPVASQTGDAVEFAPASLTTLVDSPVIAGAHLRIIPLAAGQTPRHEMNIAADSEAALLFTPDLVKNWERLVAEAGAVFGARHYREYHFLLSLSDHVAHFGLEHHESNDSRIGERGLVDENQRKLAASLLSHEYVHSWNGKYRRPADLTTPDFQQPQQTDLLWVYEGLTQYLGNILAARSGLWTADQFREHMAAVAAEMDHRPGREWRPLQDTATAAQVLYLAPGQWSSWRRSVDFYDEGALIWLEADVIIRQQTQGRRSLDDFCRAFHGGQSGPPAVKTYTFNELVSTLNQVAPYDWRAFFTARLNATGEHAPLGGLTASGWRLIYNETQGELLKAGEEVNKTTDAAYSLGIQLREDGRIAYTIFGMPAAKAGLAPGMHLIAVDGRRFTSQALRDALRAAKNGSTPLELLVENGDLFKTYSVDYHGGEQYPHLVRDTSKPDLLEQIIKPVTPVPAIASGDK